MHLKRWITGLLALPLLIWLIVQGGWIFSLFVTLVGLLTVMEYQHILQRQPAAAAAGPLAWLLPGCGTLLIAAAHAGRLEWMLLALSLCLIAGGVLVLQRFPRDPAVVGLLPAQLLGMVYVPLGLAFIVLMRGGAGGAARIFLLLVVIFGGDTGAYYAGTFFGRRKLCPAISPGKTVAGAVGGLLASMLLGLLANRLLALLPAGLAMQPLGWGAALLFTVLVAVSGQVGDLYESSLKRVGQIKDSGRLLPGHGGFLDRIDALLFGAPVAYGLYVVFA